MRCNPAALAVIALLVAAGSAASQTVHYACDAPVILDPFERFHLDHMGQSIAVGDFNGDGFKDIVMGGYNRESLDDPTPGDTITRVFVFLGTGNTPGSGLPLFRHRLTITGAATYDLFGFDLAFIGDLNSDRCSELVVGAPQYGAADAGRVSVYYGQPLLVPSADSPVMLSASAAAFTSTARSRADGSARPSLRPRAPAARCWPI